MYSNISDHFIALNSKIRRLIETRLWLKVLIGLTLGLATGILLGPDLNYFSADTSQQITDWLALPGHLFLKLVKMIVIPLVFSSIIVGLASSGDPDFLKKIAPRLGLYFILTTTTAIIIGLLTAYLIKPGQYINAEGLVSPTSEANATPTPTFSDQSVPERLVNLLPDNPLQSMVNGDMLSIVLFTLIIGASVLALSPSHLKSVIRILESIQSICMVIVRWAMELAPLAVFGFIAQLASRIGMEALSGLSMYVLTVLIGLLALLIVYNLMVMIWGRIAPTYFMRSIKETMLLAFSTSSSAAVMPLSIKTAEEKLKVKPAITQFLIPIGATINMDGTALYQAVATVFLAQVFGVDLSLTSLALIVAVTVGSSIGAPSTPGVGIVILATILESVGIPGAGVALILGVDRILDMSRTAVNVTGDLAASTIFQQRFGSMFED